jgi:hypothetical protein
MKLSSWSANVVTIFLLSEGQGTSPTWWFWGRQCRQDIWEHVKGSAYPKICIDGDSRSTILQAMCLLELCWKCVVCNYYICYIAWSVMKIRGLIKINIFKWQLSCLEFSYVYRIIFVLGCRGSLLCFIKYKPICRNVWNSWIWHNGQIFLSCGIQFTPIYVMKSLRKLCPMNFYSRSRQVFAWERWIVLCFLKYWELHESSPKGTIYFQNSKQFFITV